MLVEVDEFCAVFACCDEKRTVEEQLGNMLGTYGTDPRTAPSPRSIKGMVNRSATVPESLQSKWIYILASQRTRRLLEGVWKLQAALVTFEALGQVVKQQSKPKKPCEDQLQHCPWNCGLVGGGIEQVGLDVTVSPAVFIKYSSSGPPQGLARSNKTQSSTLSAASMTLLDVLDRVPGLIKSLPTAQWGQVMLTCSKCYEAVQHVVTEIKSTEAFIAKDFDRCWGADVDAHVSTELVQSHIPQLVKRELTKLVLMGGNIDLAVIFKMIDAKWPGLTILVLSNTGLDAECLRPLHLASWSQLRWVDLSGNSLQHQERVAATGLVQAEWPHLKGLNLRNCGLNDQAVVLLVGAYWPLSEFLDVAGGYYSASGLLHLVHAGWPYMTRLHCGLVSRSSGISAVVLMDALLTHKWSLSSLELCSSELDAAVQKQLLQGTWPRA